MTTLRTRRVATGRLTQQITEARAEGEPVVLVHGNVSSSVFWHGTLAALPAPYRPIAVDLRGFGGTDPLPVDATRGLRDYADDLAALLEALGIERAHLVGWSMGGGVVLQYLRDRPAAVRSLTLVNPVSPYGFGGTHGGGDPQRGGRGRLGRGHGEPRLRPAARRRRPRHRLPGLPAHRPHELLRQAALHARARGRGRVRRGHARHPGRRRPLPRRQHAVRLLAGHGARDARGPQRDGPRPLPRRRPAPRRPQAAGAVDPRRGRHHRLGHLDVRPGAPGGDRRGAGVGRHPAQPMLAQTRHVLDRYAAAGGSVREVAVAGAGHAIHLERPEEFGKALLEVLSA
ncbi:alpha/beta fold hydrolase [Streptomyces sp. SBR177]